MNLGSYNQYLERCAARGVEPQTYREWLNNLTFGILELARQARVENIREAEFFEQFRGDDPADQIDPVYPRGVQYPLSLRDQL